MDLSFTAEENRFRQTLRDFFTTKIPEEIRRKVREGRTLTKEDIVANHRILHAHGYAVPHWPREWGGADWTPIQKYIFAEEILLNAVPSAQQFNVFMVGPVIAAFGTEEQKRRFLPRIANIDDWWCQGFSEPGAGSDLASLKTAARREGDHYIVNGSKMFITSGVRADHVLVAARTGGPGASGVSLLLVDGASKGFSRTPLKKMGWWSSDTAALYFDDVFVPEERLVGPENGGFRLVMQNFNSERIGMAAGAMGFSMVCVEDALAWARERKTFGQPLIGHQVIRHKLVDMVERIEATRALIDDLAARLDAGEQPVAQTAMAKNYAARTMQFCADAAVQILGGSGYMRGVRVERIYREVKVMMIGGGAEEVLKDLAARQLGF